jgi:pilus assembly protein CpaE
MTDVRIVLATPSVGYEQRVRAVFDASPRGELLRLDAESGATSLTPSDLTDHLAKLSPDVVAIGPDIEVDDALKLARQLEQERPEISVLLVSEPTPELWRDALRAGVTDVLAPTALDADVRETFQRALELASRRRTNLLGDGPDATDRGRIITVLSPKGGSGKTTVASNLAVGLAYTEPDRTAIVDADVQFGDVSSALRLTPEHSLADAVRAPSGSDALTLKSYLTPHASSLWSLCAPDTPVEGEQIPSSDVQRVVQKLAEEFAYVVIDTSAGLTEHALAMVDISTDLVLVCAMDVSSVRSLRKEVDALDALGMTQQRRHLVVNRADAKVGLDLRDVEATIGQTVDVTLPSSRVVPLSMNQGTPVVESQPRTPVAKQLTSLVARFTGDATNDSGSRRRRRRDGR